MNEERTNEKSNLFATIFLSASPRRMAMFYARHFQARHRKHTSDQCDLARFLQKFWTLHFLDFKPSNPVTTLKSPNHSSQVFRKADER